MEMLLRIVALVGGFFLAVTISVLVGTSNGLTDFQSSIFPILFSGGVISMIAGLCGWGIEGPQKTPLRKQRPHISQKKKLAQLKGTKEDKSCG